MTFFRFIRCWLHGSHADVLQVDQEAGKVYLLCGECGRKTTGWVLR